jgi:uncharacterized membrane protein
LPQQDTDALRERHTGLARVEAFSDGVFAFAATLLVLGIASRGPKMPMRRPAFNGYCSRNGPAISRSR